MWRTGANEATTLVTDTNLTVGGKDIPARSYTIFTIPNADKWTLIISKKTGEWGIPYPGKGETHPYRHAGIVAILSDGKFHNQFRSDGLDVP